jgi:hypothetical protein
VIAPVRERLTFATFMGGERGDRVLIRDIEFRGDHA